MNDTITLPAEARPVATYHAAEQRPLLRNAQQVLLAGVGLGVAFDALFWGKLPGISVLLFVALVLGSIVWIGRAEGVKPQLSNLWLVLPLLFFAAMVAVRANGTLTALNLLATFGLLLLFGFFYGGGRVERVALFGLVLIPFHAMLSSLWQTLWVLPAATADLRARKGKGGPDFKPVLRGVLLAAPILLVFSALLASADTIFAGYLRNLTSFAAFRATPELFVRLGLIFCASWALIGGITYSLRWRSKPSDGEEYEDPLHGAVGAFKIGFGEVATMLVLVDLLFLGFGLIQFAYLFGGAANISQDAFTYAEYARRGFFELVVVATMSLLLILGLNALASREGERQKLVFNLLSSFMVGLVLVQVASAIYRMLLYQEAYGNTHLRLYVQVFMVWMAVALLWTIFVLWRAPRRFAIGGFVVLIGFLATLNIINPDATIAEQNLGRYTVGGTLDASYLSYLSADAMPSMVRHLPTLGAAEKGIVMRNLQDQLWQMENSGSWREWQAFNLSRWQAYTALTAAGIEPQARPDTYR